MVLLQRGIWPSGHLVIRVMFKVAANVSTARLHGADIDPKTKTGAEFREEQLRILFKNGVNTGVKSAKGGSNVSFGAWNKILADILTCIYTSF